MKKSYKVLGAVLALALCVPAAFPALGTEKTAESSEAAAAESSEEETQSSSTETTWDTGEAIMEAAYQAARIPHIYEKYSGEGYNQFAWKAVKQASQYEIWRKSGSRWKKICTLKGKHAVSYSDTGAPVYTKRTYRVRAIFKNGSKSKFSNSVTLACRLDRPVITSLTRNHITWKSVRGATKYIVYMRSSSDAGWKAIGTTKATSLSIPKKYVSATACFTVKAWAKGKYSGYDSGFTRKNMKYHSRKVLLEGDSITYYSGSWLRRSARLLGFDWDCRAVNGARITNTTTQVSKNICQRSMKRGFKGYDIIIIAAGTNDYGGSVSLGTLGSKNKKTFYGAYSAILKKARKDAPHAKIILCTPLNRQRMLGRRDTTGYKLKNKQKLTLEDYRSAIRKLAKKYHCYVYDAEATGIMDTNIYKKTRDLLHPIYKTDIALSNKFIRYMKKKIL